MTTAFLQINDTWALAADDLQWILQRRRKGGAQSWYGVSYISSTKDVLARCMKDNGIPPEDAQTALAALPHTFKEWRGSHSGLVTASSAPDVSDAPSRALPALPQESPAPESVCRDCGQDTCPCTGKPGCRHAAKWEHYMVHDSVWEMTGLASEDGYLCIGCLETRLGRSLTAADFTAAPINEPNDPWNTRRLTSRLVAA
jgi:hypothetical protein